MTITTALGPKDFERLCDLEDTYTRNRAVLAFAPNTMPDRVWLMRRDDMRKAKDDLYAAVNAMSAADAAAFGEYRKARRDGTLAEPTEAETHRAKAAKHVQDAAESFDRCDTDGFVSQWAHGVLARQESLAAEIADDGGLAEFPALFDLDGNLVAAKLIDGRYGPVWGILADDNPRGRIVAWVNAFPKRTSTMERKGYREGAVMAPAKAETWAPPGARGLGGAMSVQVVTERTDGGFSRNVRIVRTGPEETK